VIYCKPTHGDAVLSGAVSLPGLEKRLVGVITGVDQTQAGHVQSAANREAQCCLAETLQPTTQPSHCRPVDGTSMNEECVAVDAVGSMS